MEWKSAMPELWAIVRSYCEDDEEASNTIECAVENYLYDVACGDWEYVALERACGELYVEPDYIESLYGGILALGLELEEHAVHA